MNQISLVGNKETLTMSSREIAELVGKQHSNIKISAERLAAIGLIGTLALQGFTHNGNKYTEYLFNKRDSLVLVAQNCPTFTAKIVDRWQELEKQVLQKQNNFIIPQTYSEALLLAGKLAQDNERLEAKVEEDKPKVEFHDSVTNADNCHDIGELAKLLNLGYGRTIMFKKLREKGYLQQGNVPYQRFIDSGIFKVIESVFYTKDFKGEEKEKITLKTLVTGKGVVYFQRNFKD